MADLGNRLEEIERIGRALWRDVKHLADVVFGRLPELVLDEEQKAGDRRAFVRAVFALIEAIIEQQKKLILDLAACNMLKLSTGTAEALSEQVHIVEDNGNISHREQYLQLKRKIRLIFRTAEESFSETIDVKFDDKGWESFSYAIKIRNRLTHPKSITDCEVSENDLSTVNEAASWFLGFNSALVRVMARHRIKYKW